MNMMIKVLVPNFREEVQNYGPQYQRKGISISESKISKKASLSLAQHCVAEIGATNRLLAILGIVVIMMTMILVMLKDEGSHIYCDRKPSVCKSLFWHNGRVGIILAID